MVTWVAKIGRRGGSGMRISISVALGAVALLALTQVTNPAGGADAATPAQPDDVATSAPADTGVTAIEVAPSGHLRKEFGEPAGLTLAGSATAYFELTVVDVTVVTDCPARGVDVAPEHGYFVLVDVAASMSAEVAALVPGEADPFMPVTADAFSIAGENLHTLTDSSWACFEAEDLAPPFVGAGETVRGLVVLDSPVAAGTLVYAPAGTGWEWKFGR